MESLIPLNILAAADLESAVVTEKLEDQVAVTEIVFQELEHKPVERQEELTQVKIEIMNPIDTVSAVAPQQSGAKVAVTEVSFRELEHEPVEDREEFFLRHFVSRKVQDWKRSSDFKVRGPLLGDPRWYRILPPSADQDQSRFQHWKEMVVAWCPDSHMTRVFIAQHQHCILRQMEPVSAMLLLPKPTHFHRMGAFAMELHQASVQKLYGVDVKKLLVHCLDASEELGKHHATLASLRIDCLADPTDDSYLKLTETVGKIRGDPAELAQLGGGQTAQLRAVHTGTSGTRRAASLLMSTNDDFYGVVETKRKIDALIKCIQELVRLQASRARIS